MMTKQHQYLEKKFNWYKKWHQDKLSKFVHYFVLIIVVFAFVFDSFAVLFYSQRASAASPWSIDTQAEWNAGSYTNTDATAGGNLELTSQPTWYNSTASTFYDSSYSYRRKITFDNSAQAENLANFPVMVKATNDELNWSSIVQADLDDVIFVDSDNTTLLNWEWEKKLSSGESIAWVKVPQIDASSTTDKIYMYYGNATAADQTSSTNVWTNGYVGVWHLKEPSGNAVDSTSGARNLVNAGTLTYGATGQINSAVTFDGSSAYFRDDADDANLDFAGDFTIEGWGKTAQTDMGTIVQKGMYGGVWSGWLLGIGGTSKKGTLGINGVNLSGTVDRNDGSFHQYVGVRSGSNGYLYEDGGQAATASVGSSSTDSDKLASIGVRYNTTATPGLALYWNGGIDEVRVSSTARSAPWIAAEYKNQGPNTFTTFGAPQNSDSYSYRRKITFDNSAQAENLVNFPVDVKANNSSLAWSSLIQADMDDVVFVDADDTTPLSFEWETEAPAGDSIAWVKVPQINASSSADYVYMYYGNGSGANLEHQEGVWSNNYTAVYHLNEASYNGTASEVKDATKNDLDAHAVGSATTSASGYFGRTGDFTAAQSTTKLITETSWDPNRPQTVQAWAKASSYSGWANVVQQGWNPDTSITTNYGGDSKPRYQFGGNQVNSNVAFSTGEWHSVVGTVDSGTTQKIYTDGTLRNSGATSGEPNSYNFVIGNTRDNWAPYNGYIDEVRISSTDRSAPWIAAEYKNQTDTFNTIDSEQTSVAVTGTYSSVVKDMAFNTTLNLFNSTASLGSGTASYFLRTGPTAVPDGSWTGWISVTPGANPDPSLDNNRYAQAKIDLTGDGSTTPLIDSFTLTYASVAGSSTITSPTDGATFGAGDVSIAGTAAANSGAALDKVEISTNGGADWNDATGTDNWTYLFAGPASGTYNLKSRAHNNDGVYETAGAGITITVDADKPTSAVSYPTTGGYYSPNLLVTGTASDIGGGIVSNLDIRITKQGTGVVKDWTAVTNTGTNFSTWSYTQDGLLEDDQTYIIESRATDNFGNVQTILGSSTITIDLTYPSSTITNPKLDDKFKVEDRKIDGTATTNNGQALSKVDIRILKLSDPNLKTTADTAGKTVIQDWTLTLGTASWSYTIPASLFQAYGGGYFQIQSRATNVVNLVETPSPGITILVDDKPPTTPENIILRDATNYSEGTVSLFLQFDKSTDPETRVKEYKITLNGKESVLKTPDKEDPSVKNLSLLLTANQGAKEGANSVLLKTIDEVDNESTPSKSAQVEIKKETAAIKNIEIKNVSLVKKQGDEETTSALVKYSSDIPASTVVFWDQSNPEGSGAKIYVDSAPSQSHTAILDDLVPDSNYKVKIEGIDNFGNKISSDIQSFRSTPKPTEESIFSIIIQALKDAFSWVQKVMAAPFMEKGDPFVETKNYLALRAIDTSSQNDEIQTSSSAITKTPQIALSFRKNSLPLRNNQNLTGLALNSLISANIPTKAEKENIIDNTTGIALDKAPLSEKTIYKLFGIDISEKTLLPGKENELAPSISDIETKEIITSGDKAEYLITFKTDIPSQGKLGLKGQELTEEGNNISHSFYVDNLNSGDTIRYKITVISQYDKITESADQSFTVPAQPEEKGIWRIIIDALISAFSWFKNLMK